MAEINSSYAMDLAGDVFEAEQLQRAIALTWARSLLTPRSIINPAGGSAGEMIALAEFILGTDIDLDESTEYVPVDDDVDNDVDSGVDDEVDSDIDQQLEAVLAPPPEIHGHQTDIFEQIADANSPVVRSHDEEETAERRALVGLTEEDIANMKEYWLDDAWSADGEKFLGFACIGAGQFLEPCGLIYVSIADRMLKEPSDCHGCQLKGRWG